MFSLDTLLTSFMPLEQHVTLLWLIIFFIALIESLVLLGWLLPGTVILASLGLLIGTHNLAILPAWLAAWIGTVLGHVLSFSLGAYAPRTWLNIYPLTRYPYWLKTCESFFASHGGKSILLGRFIAPIRPFLPLAAGLSGMKFSYFVLMDSIAGALWISLYLLPTAGIGHTWQYWSHPMEQALPVIVILSLCIILAWYFRHKLFMTFKQSSINQQLLLVSLLSLVGFVSLCCYLEAAWLKSLDHAIWQHWQFCHKAWHWLGYISPFAAKENLFFCYASISCILLIQKHYRLLIIWTLAGIGTAGIVGITKHLFALPRPTATSSYLELHAFPSGHMILSAQFWLGFLGLLTQKSHNHRLYGVILCLWLILVALSRIQLGAHWFSDILGGLLLGVTLGLWTMLLLRQTPIQHTNAISKVTAIIWLIAGLGITWLQK